ncbi:YIP1 family protein [Alphaproteobacteria bacterium KMM 3653]|uniref:YIP1 family protein n=1 Tax=Harenicola maris TaxID=2841044 RepID=A0AAP2CP67_9RHOB|nr:YIP1 family protein [Harenicola maris]
MDLNFATIGLLLRKTIAEPRQAARDLMGLNLGLGPSWQAFALAVVMTVLVGQGLGMLLSSGAPEQTVIATPPGADGSQLNFSLTITPVMGAMILGLLLVFMVFCVHWIGRVFGGQGRFEDSLVVMAWHQFAMVVLQVAMVLLITLIPAMSGLAVTMILVANFILLSLFVTEIHGFSSLPKVFAMIIVSMLVVAFALSLVISIALVAAGVEVPNA